MLDVEVADESGSAAKFAEKLAGLLCRLGVLGKIGQKSEKFHLGFDAASRGSEAVDGFAFGIGEREGDGGFKVCDQVAQGEHGMGLGCHGSWMRG